MNIPSKIIIPLFFDGGSMKLDLTPGGGAIAGTFGPTKVAMMR
jgi:hypothetical protein